MYSPRLKFAAAFAALALLSSAATAATMDSQSPIDIITRNAVYDPALESLDFNYGNAIVTELFHTTSPDPEEQTVQERPLPGRVQPANTIELGGKVFSFLQFHAHIGAEHLINGVRGALEFHFVHRAMDQSLAVVGLIAKVGAANAAFAEYFDNLARVPLALDRYELTGTLNLAALLPADQRTYRYVGSLTTAPYSEGVLWNVFAQQIEISPEQLKAFELLFDEGNSRGVQAINGRRVVTDVAPVPLPLPAFSLMLGLAGLAGLRRFRARQPVAA